MRNNQDIITEKFNELRALTTSYAKQEVRDPITALAKWVSLGLLGMIFIITGITFASLGLLRLFQSEISFFNNSFSFMPYLFVFIALISIAVFSIKAARRHR